MRPNRILLTTSPWPGHYYPMVPLGRALQAAGHEVTVMCCPAFARTVRPTGLPVAAVLNDEDPVFWMRLWHLLRVQSGAAAPGAGTLLHPITGAVMSTPDEFDWPGYQRDNHDRWEAEYRAQSDAIAAFAGDWSPDLVVHDMVNVDGISAAAVAGVPAVLHLWGPVGIDEDEPGLDIAPDYNNAMLRDLGVTAAGRDLVKYVIDPCPASLAPQVSSGRLKMRYVPYNGPGSAPDWLTPPGPRRRVCVTWGSTTARFGAGSMLVSRIVRALARHDVEIVVTVRPEDAARLGDLPGDVRVLEEVPISELLPGCAAVVHHGSAGAVMAAVAAGVPQLCLPFEKEQDANGSRLAATGAGLHLRGPEADQERLDDAVAEILTNTAYGRAAGRLRAELDERPSPEEFVDVLLDLARTGEPPVTDPPPELLALRPGHRRLRSS